MGMYGDVKVDYQTIRWGFYGNLQDHIDTFSLF